MCKYAIIGGGIGGLTLALGFEKLGVDYALYEKAEQVKEVGAGIWLPPNALQVLQWIDQRLLDKVIENGNAIKRITLADHHLNPISDIDQGFVEAEYGFSTVAIHRAKLQGILLESLPKEKIHLGKAFRKYELLKSNEIKISFEDRSSVLAKNLIGADGLRSKVRNQLFPMSQLRYSGQSCWRGVATYDIDPSFYHRGIEMWGKQLRFGISRLEKGKVYWFAVALSGQNLKDDTSLLKEKLITMFKDFHPEAIRLIQNTAAETIIRTDLNDLKLLEAYASNNICLIGDAAHGMTPDLGQGGAQAIEDGYYLSNLISKGKDIDSAFSKFYELRHKKVNGIVKQSWNTGKIANLSFARGFRNFMLRSIPDKLLKKQVLAMYKINKTIAEKV